MSCLFYEVECIYKRQTKKYPPTLATCELCLKAKTQWVAQIKPLIEDYGRNLMELNQLREEKRQNASQLRPT